MVDALVKRSRLFWDFFEVADPAASLFSSVCYGLVVVQAARTVASGRERKSKKEFESVWGRWSRGLVLRAFWVRAKWNRFHNSKKWMRLWDNYKSLYPTQTSASDVVTQRLKIWEMKQSPQWQLKDVLDNSSWMRHHGGVGCSPGQLMTVGGWRHSSCCCAAHLHFHHQKPLNRTIPKH